MSERIENGLGLPCPALVQPGVSDPLPWQL